MQIQSVCVVLQFPGDRGMIRLFRRVIMKRKKRLRNTHLESVSASEIEIVDFFFLGCFLISEGQDKWRQL